MQTFSIMQRSITYKNLLNAAVIVTLFALYQSASSMYLLLPPLLAVLFFHFMRSLEKEDMSTIILLTFLMLIFEAEKDFLLVSTLVYFTFLYRFIIPALRIMISCKICLKAMLVVLAYLGFIAYSYILNQVLWVETPSIDWHIFYYMVIEFFLVLNI